MSVSRIWAARKSPRPVSAECFNDLLPRRCTRDLPAISGGYFLQRFLASPKRFPRPREMLQDSVIFLQASDSNANVDGMHPNIFSFHGFHEGSRIKDKG